MTSFEEMLTVPACTGEPPFNTAQLAYPNGQRSADVTKFFRFNVQQDKPAGQDRRVRNVPR